jgi:hypothetical protein
MNPSSPIDKSGGEGLGKTPPAASPSAAVPAAALAEIRAFICALAASLDADSREEFRPIEQAALKYSMLMCGLSEYPPVVGPPDGERCSGDMICSGCGRAYFSHPMDWRVIGYGNFPFLNVLCDGRRVKL